MGKGVFYLLIRTPPDYYHLACGLHGKNGHLSKKSGRRGKDFIATSIIISSLVGGLLWSPSSPELVEYLLDS